ncbi:MAG: metallophosphoesterase [Clostridia bacterium]|nr:metallophosphoesterase [Clostridia bacterium]
MKPVSFYLVTDTHYFENQLGSQGKAYDEYMKREQYFMRESHAIISSTFSRIAEDKQTDIVIIPGDLSKNGEKESHISFIKELDKLQEAGKKIFVITAGHDYNELSYGYVGDERIDVAGTGFDELYDLYRDFGYADALSFDKRTHSYTAQITDGVRMLAINCDSFNNPKGTMDDELMSWAKVQLDKAKADNCSVFAICHYPIIPSVPVFDFVGDAKIKDWRRVASFLADNGVELALTGHMHIQSINEFYSEKGNRLIDVCTSCLVGSPAKYRKITVNENSRLKVETLSVGDFDADMNGLTVQEYFDRQFAQAILNRVCGALDGGAGIVKHLKKFGLKFIRTATVGTLGRILFIKTDKTLAKKKLTDFIQEIGLGIFAGDMPYVEGTPVHDVISHFLKRFSFVIRRIEPRLEKDGIKVNLSQMLIDTIGNNKGFSDNDAEFTLR